MHFILFYQTRKTKHLLFFFLQDRIQKFKNLKICDLNQNRRIRNPNLEFNQKLIWFHLNWIWRIFVKNFPPIFQIFENFLELKKFRRQFSPDADSIRSSFREFAFEPENSKNISRFLIRKKAFWISEQWIKPDQD